MQTVIGEEALEQLALVGETPDLIVGCTGGGSNFGGLCFPFLRCVAAAEGVGWNGAGLVWAGHSTALCRAALHVCCAPAACRGAPVMA